MLIYRGVLEHKSNRGKKQDARGIHYIYCARVCYDSEPTSIPFQEEGSRFRTVSAQMQENIYHINAIISFSPSWIFCNADEQRVP